MKKIKKKNVVLACMVLTVGLLLVTGCNTDKPLKGEVVVVPTLDSTLATSIISRDVSLHPKYDPGTVNSELTKRMVAEMGSQLQGVLRSRGHRIVPSGGALVEFRVSIEEFRPYKDEKLDWRTYSATAEVQVSAANGIMQRQSFIVDGRTLDGRRYYIQERQALAPVQTELLKQIDAWLASVLVIALPLTR